MRIAVVGAGSMGSLFGGLLALAGEDVWLIDPRADHVEAVRANGLLMSHEGQEWRAPVHATTDPNEPGPVDLIIVMVKSFDTLAACEAARPLLGPKTIALSLQNGLGNPEKIAAGLGTSRVIAGVTELGANLEDPGHIELSGNVMNNTADNGGLTSIGAWQDGPARTEVEKIAACFEAANMRIAVRDDIEAFVWTKLAFAASMAPLTAITGLRVGGIIGNEGGRTLVKEIIDEIVAVATAKGVVLDRDAVQERAIATFTSIKEHTTSMAADVQALRRTEIGALSGGVVAEAERLGMDVPVNRVLAGLVGVIEQGYGERTA